MLLLKVPISAISPATYTVAGLIALPSTHSSSSQSWPWLVGIKATPSGFVANSCSSVPIPQYLSPPQR